MDKLAAEGLDYFERAGDEGDKKYVAAIRAELDALCKDAERYRWLRKNGKPAAEGLVMRNPDLWDAAIDAAMKGANG